MKHFVIGLGEVGQAVREVFQCEGTDKELQLRECEVLHICVPYQRGFRGKVRVWQQETKATYVVVHSTVPVGTCEELGVVHAPVRGVHPHLAESLTTFVQYLGSADTELTREFQAYGFSTVNTTSRTTEALKLWDTTQYGLHILIEKLITRYCEKHNVDRMIVYENANQTYNKGYESVGRKEVVRPWLHHYPGKIGGHCVVPNAKLLGGIAGNLVRFINWLL